jgi:acetate kinase
MWVRCPAITPALARDAAALACARAWCARAGNGSSIAAIKGGVSIDTSMGLTPLEGCVC